MGGLEFFFFSSTSSKIRSFSPSFFRLRLDLDTDDSHSRGKKNVSRTCERGAEAGVLLFLPVPDARFFEEAALPVVVVVVVAAAGVGCV